MRRRAWMWLFLACASAAAGAETAYVTDHFTVALRADAAPDAPIVKSVPTGTELEVIERRDSLVKVRDGGGTEGWVVATALIPQPPAAVQLRALRAEIERTRAQLAAAQAELHKARPAPAADPEAARLRTQLGGLKSELDAARAQLAAAQAELQEKAAALQQKEEQLAVLASAATTPAAPLPYPDPEVAPKTSSGFSVLWAGIAFAMLLIGFVGGIVWVKESIRRRMGGMYLRI